MPTTTLNELLSSITSAVAEARRTADNEAEKTRLLYQRVQGLASLSVPRLRIPEVTLEIPVLMGPPSPSPAALRTVSQTLISALPETVKAASDELAELELSSALLDRLTMIMRYYAGSLTQLPDESELTATVDNALNQVLREPGFMALVISTADSPLVAELGYALEGMVRNHIVAYFNGKPLRDAVVWIRKQIRPFLQGLAAGRANIALVPNFDQHFEALFESELVARVLNDPTKPSDDKLPSGGASEMIKKADASRLVQAPLAASIERPMRPGGIEPDISISEKGDGDSLSDAIVRTGEETIVDGVAQHNFVIATRVAYARAVQLDGMMALLNNPEHAVAVDLRSRATAKVRELVRGALLSAKDVTVTLPDPEAKEPVPAHLLTRLKVVLAEEGSG